MSLTAEDTILLTQMIPQNVKVVVSVVAQLYLSYRDLNVPEEAEEREIIPTLRENGIDKWSFTDIEGALLLTINDEGVLHFRIYDLDQYKLRFQHELYENLDYRQLSEQFHVFEAHSFVCGFNFASSAVAKRFYVKVQAEIPRTPPLLSRSVRKKNSSHKKIDNESNIQEKYLSNGVLDPKKLPSEWKKILKRIGITKKDVRNPENFQLIKEILSAHGIDLELSEEVPVVEIEPYVPLSELKSLEIISSVGNELPKLLKVEAGELIVGNLVENGNFWRATNADGETGLILRDNALVIKYEDQEL